MDVKVELIAELQCPKCKGIPYQLWRRQVQPGSDVFQNELRVGSKGGTLPKDRKHLICKPCNRELIQREHSQ